MARSWAREPLVHFLLAGAAIFVVTASVAGGGDTRTISIDRQQLVDYMLARAEITDRNQFDAVYGAMSADERAELLRRVAQDEALYREGLSIGLDKADPLIRQRIIQQMRQLLGDEAAAAQPLTDAAVESFYLAHRENYRMGDTVSFAHVFFAARQDAQAELKKLRDGKVPPAAAAAHGERFLYETFNRDVDRDGVIAKFGATFAARCSRCSRASGRARCTRNMAGTWCTSARMRRAMCPHGGTGRPPARGCAGRASMRRLEAAALARCSATTTSSPAGLPE